jgi:hypothetical protein
MRSRVWYGAVVRWAWCSAGLWGLPAMSASAGPSTPAVSIERVSYHGWADAYRLRNDTVELVVVPTIARIVHYGYLGKANLLWENAALQGLSPAAGRWFNYGGDKIWLWPQEEWPARCGSGWPPSTDLPGLIAHAAAILESGLRLTSPSIPGLGVRTIREIRLAQTGTQVLLTNRIERLATDADFGLAPWTVTQLPADGRIFARLLPGTQLPDGYRVMDAAPFQGVTRVTDRVLMIERPKDRRARIRLDADVLAWQRGEDLFVERSVDVTPLSAVAPGERAQIYSHLDGDTELPLGVSYIELELAEATRTLRAGESATLKTTWELLHLPASERTPQAIADRLCASR